LFLSELTDRQKGLLAACVTAATWSLLAILLKIALKYSDSYSIVWYRMLVSSSALMLWFLYQKQTADLRVFLKPPKLLLIAALCLGFNYVGFMQGVHYASPASAQIFIQIGPLLLALAGVFVFKEKLTRQQSLGLVFCVFGFGFFFSDRVGHPQIQESFYLGLIWIVAAAVTWALFASLLKKLLTEWKSSQVNIFIYVVVTLLYLPVVDWPSLAQAPWWVHALYIFLGFNTILAYGCLSIALRYLPATQVSPIITMNPLLTLVLITLIDALEWTIIPADPIGWKGYTGAVVAILGVRSVIAKNSGPKS
jgi:drug/metabolite transporter (DMT)-like permease